jgi:hypothetical protein
MSVTANYYAITADEYNAIMQNPAHILEVMENAQDSIYLEKAWHGIHYLLTGRTNGPWEDSVIAGGYSLPYAEALEEMFTDLPFVFPPALVQHWSEILLNLTVAELKARYNPVEMEQLGIYPQVWVSEGDKGFEYLMLYLGDLIDLFEFAANENLAVIGLIE